MNTTTNTRGVSEAMYTPEQIEAAFEQWENDASVISLFAAFKAGVAYAAALSAPEPAAFTDEDRVLSAIDADPSGAALQFAEPAAQGEEGFDARKYVRHMADVLEAGGDLFKVDADLLRLAAAINKAANTAPPAQPAARVPEGEQ